MAKKIKLQKFTGIEIGTDKVKVVIAEIPEDADRVSVLGAGCRPSLKVQKGDILDIGIVTEQVELAMGEAEDQAGLEINDTIVFMAVPAVISVL